MTNFVSLLTLCALAPATAMAQNAQVKVVLDTAFRTVAPPNDAFAQNVTHVVTSTSVMFAIAAFFSVVAFFDCRRFKSTVPISMVFGAAFCVVPEAIDNYLAGCYWSQSHNPKMLMFCKISFLCPTSFLGIFLLVSVRRRVNFAPLSRYAKRRRLVLTECPSSPHGPRVRLLCWRDVVGIRRHPWLSALCRFTS